MSLNKIIAEVTDANEKDGVINRHAAINDAVPQIIADKEMVEMCVRGHVSKLIATNVRNRKRDESKLDGRQSSFFKLRDDHILPDGEGVIKRTEALTRIEFESLIRLRQDQVNADQAYLMKLREAARVTRPIWNQHPDWLWGQVEDAYARQRQAA